MTKEHDLINIAFDDMKRVGIHPNQRRYCMMSIIVINIMRMLHIWLVLRTMLTNLDNLNIALQAGEAFASYVQGLAKSIPLIFYRQSFKNIYNGINEFWDLTDDYNIYKLWFRSNYTYRYTFYFTASIVVVPAIISKNFVFPFHISKESNFYQFALYGQYIQTCFDVVYVISVDIFYISTCILLYRQFTLLLGEINSFKIETNLKIYEQRIKTCIKYHTYLLRYTNELITMYKYCLLVQYGLSTFSICILLISISEGDTYTKFTSIFYMTCVIFQLTLYCFPADEITAKAAQVSEYIYDTNWYNCPVHLQNHIPNIIQRSQKDLKFTAGNMVTINRAAFTKIFQNGLSFYTLANKMRN